MMRLTIQHRTQVGDNFDEYPDRWEDLRQEYFRITPLSAREFVQSQGVESTVSHRGECPYFAGANSAMRLTDGTRMFNVASVVNRNEQNRKLDWMLTEVANG